ncbi:DUF1963 domain-containing protein [Streptomyces sp. HSW2009]|uniref:DUF1963 domain-containing protein n=1 Tax=Streptomyces sp. HSW2009 TaxID=3142890 RepID=UPI0032EC21F8
MVATLRIEAFVPAESPITAPVTKFGGQPVWLAEPQWPVNEAWGEPMRFVCQIELSAVLGEAGRGKLAYVFVTHAEFGDVTFFDPDVIFPDEGANAVVVQPDGDSVGATLPLVSGPSLYHAADGSAAEYTVVLRPDSDVEPEGESTLACGGEGSSDPGRKPEPIGDDKLGGTPAFFQGDDWPPGGPWKLLLQLSPNFLPFHLHLGSAPLAFAFVSPDASRGRFLVQDS